ncbi:MAG: DNA-processing protein DprA [Gemmatimonas sp.]|nr:DNA-processing protein DprA [Gemmatimonas sp.]
MDASVSPNTQAILLLTAPLIAGRRAPDFKLLSPGEYRQLARRLHDHGRTPADLVRSGSEEVLAECAGPIDLQRLRDLLSRGFLLSRAVDRWHSRSIWLASRADPAYPDRIRRRVKVAAPPLFYGSGDPALLDSGGLAVVGSRHINDEIAAYAERIGSLAAEAGVTIVSGGAQGVDQAAMRGCAEAGGRVVAVLSDRLERVTLDRATRDLLRDGRLTLISPYDPSARFHVGHAMARNKLIYALADTGLVASAELEKGGTWAGAVEQLRKLHYVPLFVRENGIAQPGLHGLLGMGAQALSEPASPDELIARISNAGASDGYAATGQRTLSLGEKPEPGYPKRPGAPVPVAADQPAPRQVSKHGDVPPEVRDRLLSFNRPFSLAEITQELQARRPQVLKWLNQLMEEGVLEKQKKPARYRCTQASLSLFGVDPLPS